jgi:hypothetical protein
MHTASTRLYLTAAPHRLVREGDPDARWLFCVPGQQVPDAEARRYGLVPGEASPEPTTEEPPAGTPEAESTPDPGKLRGKALDEALKTAGLPTRGRLAEKRERLAEWQAAQAEA